MQFDWWTFALQTANFAILVWLLHRFLYKPVLRIIDARRDEVGRQYTEAEQTKAQAKTQAAEVAAERAGIAAERAAALKAAAAQAEEAAQQRLQQVTRQATAQAEAARQALIAERQAALQETRKASLDLGVAMARRLLDEIPAALRAEAWLEKIEGHLNGLTAAARAELHAGQKQDALHVVTATALPAEMQTQWQTRLHRILGTDVAITFAVDASLIAGAELHFSNAILRFSWRDALAAIRKDIETDGETD